MKKTAIYLAAAIISFSSCGGGSGELKADVEKIEKLKCEKNKLKEKISAGDSTLTAQYEKIREDVKQMEDKLRDKYKDKAKDDSFREKARKYTEEARNACK